VFGRRTALLTARLRLPRRGYTAGMAGYTKLNVKDDIEDQAPKFGVSPDLEFRVARDPIEA
jgi:hypothetical protein